MTLINNIFIYLILATLPLSCCSQKNIPGNNDAKIIEVTQGDTFSIDLPSHPGTGFTWQIKGDIDSTMLSLIKNEYREIGDETLDIPGSDYFEFQTLNKGKTHIHFWYIRLWKKEHNYPGIKKEMFIITIN